MLAWLHSQATVAFEEFLEDMSMYCGADDWEPVDDDTPQEALPLLINHGSPVVQILAKHRLAGHSIYDNEVYEELWDLLGKAAEEPGDPFNMDYKQGRFYQIAQMYEMLKEDTLKNRWKKWAFFDPFG
jgi:hypothetical protein